MNFIEVYFVSFTNIVSGGKVYFERKPLADRIKKTIDEVEEDLEILFACDPIELLRLYRAYEEAKVEEQTYLDPDRDDVVSLFLDIPIGKKVNLHIYVQPEDGDLECIGNMRVEILAEETIENIGDIDQEILDELIDNFADQLMDYANRS
jgi:hypothetical protein